MEEALEKNKSNNSNLSIEHEAKWLKEEIAKLALVKKATEEFIDAKYYQQCKIIQFV